MSELISGPDIPTLKLVHDDERRTIRETDVQIPGRGIRRVTDIAIKAGALGNHYHPGKAEYFSVISGNPTVVTAPSDDPTNITVRHFPEGGHLTIEPGEAHVFDFPGPGHIIATMEGAYNPADTVPQQLAIPKTDSKV